MKISRVSQMRQMDHEAVMQYGIVEELLMENAGNAVYFVILKHFSSLAERRFAIFCGLGNNGGDGLVVARKLCSMGSEVTVFLLGDPEKYQGSARRNYEIAKLFPLKLQRLSSIDQVGNALTHTDAVVDAMLGTGLSRPLKGLYLDAVQTINRSGKTVFSVDIPSGINGDTGEVMGDAIQAHVTVTFGLPKRGNLLYPGFDYGGRLYVSHISFPPTIYNKEELQVETGVPERLPVRARDTHKGDYGKILFIAGSPNYLGAPQFSALSFLKAGGGLSYLATPKSLAPFLGSRSREVVLFPLWETDTGSISLKNLEGLLMLCNQMDMAVMGPGLSLEDQTQELVRKLTEKIPIPLLLDGDGITAVSQDPEILKNRRSTTILTPHPGEMARLTGKTIEEIKKNRVEILQETAKSSGAIIVLKGAHTLIGFPEGQIWINLSGNPGMATAGSGDVLTGCISAMVGRGLPIANAVKTGVFLHGLAGDLAAAESGEDGVVAGQIMDTLPAAVRVFREKYEEYRKTNYGKIWVI